MTEKHHIIYMLKIFRTQSYKLSQDISLYDNNYLNQLCTIMRSEQKISVNLLECMYHDIKDKIYSTVSTYCLTVHLNCCYKYQYFCMNRLNILFYSDT